MKKFSFFLIGLLLSLVSFAQFSISGKVNDAETNRPLGAASISLYLNGKVVQNQISADNGSYSFNKLKPGAYYLVINYLSYPQAEKKVELLNSSAEVDINIKPLTQVSDECVIITVRFKNTAAATFTNISKKEIEKQNFGQDVPFLLNQTPSVVVNSDAGAGIGYTGMRIRGVDPTRTNVTINGIPVNDAESHGTFWVNTPDLASSTQSIQIQRGVGTSTNGAAAFGASVNIQTDQMGYTPYSEVSTSLGSFNSRKHTLKVGTGLMENKWAIDARLSMLKSDGFIDRSFSDLKSYFVSATRVWNHSSIKFNVFSGREQTYQAWNGVPEARLKGDVNGMVLLTQNLYMSSKDSAHLLNSGNKTYNQFTYPNQTDNYQQDHYQFFYSYNRNNRDRLNIGLHYTYGRGFYEEYRSGEPFSRYKMNDVVIGSDTISNSDFIRRRWLDNDFYGTVFSYTMDRGKRFFTFGGAINRYDGRHFGELIWAQNAAINFNNQRFYEGKSTKTDISLYGKLDYEFTKKFEGFVDLQYRGVGYQLKGEDLNGSNYIPYDFDLNFDFFNPKAGLTYQLNGKTQFYAYAGVAHREPVRNDIIQASKNSVPKPERMYNGELGYKRYGNIFSINMNAFYMDYVNQLVNSGQVNDVGAYNRVNVPRSYRAGLEGVFGVKIRKDLKWTYTAAYSKNRIKDFTEYVDNWDLGGQNEIKYKNSSIAFSPEFISSSVLNYENVKGFSASWIVKTVSKQYLDNTQSEARKIDGFVVNDLVFSYEIKRQRIFKSARIGLQLNNVLGEEYQPNGYVFSGIIGGQRTDFNYFYPQAGRNFMMNLVVSF
jgi:iron complex outermembrane receptor protein